MQLTGCKAERAQAVSEIEALRLALEDDRARHAQRLQEIANDVEEHHSLIESVCSAFV